MKSTPISAKPRENLMLLLPAMSLSTSAISPTSFPAPRASFAMGGCSLFPWKRRRVRRDTTFMKPVAIHMAWATFANERPRAGLMKRESNASSSARKEPLKLPAGSSSCERTHHDCTIFSRHCFRPVAGGLRVAAENSGTLHSKSLWRLHQHHFLRRPGRDRSRDQGRAIVSQGQTQESDGRLSRYREYRPGAKVRLQHAF